MKKPAQSKPVSTKPKPEDPATVPARIGRVFENKMQFEEAVLQQLREWDGRKPKGIYY